MAGVAGRGGGGAPLTRVGSWTATAVTPPPAEATALVVLACPVCQTPDFVGTIRCAGCGACLDC